MEQWRAEFQFWQTEQEEYEEFAQALCLEFQNWRTHQEELQEYGNQFLQLHFQNLPIDVIRAFKRKVWKSISQGCLQKALTIWSKGTSKPDKKNDESGSYSHSQEEMQLLE